MIAGRHILHKTLLDMTAQVVADRGQERIHLVRGSLSYQFHIPARQVADVTRNLVRRCQMLGRVPEADALNPAGIPYLFTQHHCFIVGSPWLFVHWSGTPGGVPSGRLRMVNPLYRLKFFHMNIWPLCVRGKWRVTQCYGRNCLREQDFRAFE